MRRGLPFGAAVLLAALVTRCGGDPSAERADTTWPDPTCHSHEVDRTKVDEPVLPADDGGRLQAIADSFCARWFVQFPSGSFSALVPPLPEDDARCVGQGLLDLLGTERVEALGFGTGPWNLLSFGLGHGGEVEAEETASMVEVFARCSPSFEQLLILSVTEGTDEISAGSAACVSDELNDKTAKAILAGEMDRAYDTDPQATPFPELVAPLVDAYDQCLTPAERSRLDFN